MKKIFEEYGGVITVAMAIVALICVVALLVGGPNGGWIGNAFKGITDKFLEKTSTAMDAVSVAEGEHVYTLEEIDADDHLYGIGATKAAYVVAKFNDDYTEVTIFANGPESDGKIKNYTGKDTPLFAHADTLKKANITKGVTTLGDNTFWNCTFLSEVNIPNTVTAIGLGCFNRCQALTSVVIPDSVTTIVRKAFNECTGLTSVTLSKNITELPEFAFYAANQITTITIPEGVTSIGAYAFGCTSGTYTIEDVYIPNSVTTMEDTSIQYPSKSYAPTIHVKEGSYAETWATGKGLTVVYY